MSKFSGIADTHRKLGENAPNWEPNDERMETPEGSRFSGIVDKRGKTAESAAAAGLEFNGERIEAQEGETVAQAARRHGSHVWFLCDGHGICQTCECRVLSGAENLSEVSRLERAGLAEKRRQKGYRLGCQARLLGAGSVAVISRAEELRRRAREVLFGSQGRSLWARLQDLSGDSLNATVDLMAGVTRISPQVIPQLVKDPPTPARLASYVRDTLRVAGRLLK